MKSLNPLSSFILKIYRCFLVIFILAFYCEQINAKNTLILSKEDSFHLASYFSYFTETSEGFTIDSAVLYSKKGAFYSKTPNLMEPHTKYWIHINIHNLTSIPTWMLYFKAELTHIEIYKLLQDSSIEVGLPFRESVNNYHKIKEFIHIAENEHCEFFIRIHEELPIEYDLKNSTLVPYQTATKEIIEQSTIEAIIAGIMCFMLLNSIFQYLYRKQRVYLFYVLYIVFHLIFLINGSYIIEYVILKKDQFSLNWLYISLSIGHLFYIWFVYDFIGKENIPKKLDTYYYSPYKIYMLSSTVLLIVLAYVNNYIFMQVYYILPLTYAVLGLILAILLIQQVKQVESKLVLIGTCITIFTGFLSLFLHNNPKIQNNHIYNIGMVVDMIFFTFALNYKRNKEIEAAHESNLKYALVKQNLDHNQRELTHKAMKLAQQEELFGNLKTQLESLKSLNDKNQETIASIVSNIEFYLKDTSWNEFEFFFSEVHPEFQHKLKETYPELTQNDLRICSLLRLCLNTKEIASITQKTSKSIEISRSRIRQKMGLSRDENLFDVLSKID